jgi:hypothetical protein
MVEAVSEECLFKILIVTGEGKKKKERMPEGNSTKERFKFFFAVFYFFFFYLYVHTMFGSFLHPSPPIPSFTPPP